MTAFDPALARKYDVSAPRYTSYPTAPQFRTDFGEADVVEAIRLSNGDPIPRELSVYVHIPYCLSPCFYCGCARIVTHDRGRAETYLVRLAREIERIAALFDRDRRLAQLHFGGGTPNFLSQEQLLDLIDSLGRHFAFADPATREFGIEIDPRSCDGAYARALAEAGMDRFSIGVQDFDTEVQRAINRVQSVEETAAVMAGARAGGARSINLDLIYGLPLQSVASFATTLDTVIALRPERIAAYGYAHLPERFAAQKQIDKHDLPDAATRLRLLQSIVERLTDAGYVHVGMDHFALPGDELARAYVQGTLQRNFQGYSTHAACDLVGFGMTAISHIGPSFSQNAKDVIGYHAAIDHDRLPVARGLWLGEDDLVRAELIQHLMCGRAIDIADFERRHRLEFGVAFAESLQHLRPLADDGLIECTAERIAVTPRGQFLLRNIARCFDAYAERPEVRYSRAI